MAKHSLKFNRVKRRLIKVDWEKGRRHLTELKAATEDWGSKESGSLPLTAKPHKTGVLSPDASGPLHTKV